MPNARHAQTWRVTLSPEQNALLRVPSIARDLMAFAARRWVEHVVIGDPFGVLGLDASGKASWLQLESRQGLTALAELAELEGAPPAALEEIRAGRGLAALELSLSPAPRSPVELVSAFPLGQDQALVGAVFDIKSPDGTTAANGFANWLARQEARHVEK